MWRYLLDTTPLAAYLLGRPAALTLITPWIQRQEAVTSILAYGEVIEYIRGRPDYFLLYGDLRGLLRAVPPIGVNYAIMERYADIRRGLRPPHGPGLIGDVDTLIAATALVRGLTLVTADGDHQRVSGLNVLPVSFK